MDAYSLREMFKVRVQDQLAKVEAGILGDSAMPDEFATYTRQVGYRRGLVDCLTVIDDCFKEIHEPPQKGDGTGT